VVPKSEGRNEQLEMRLETVLETAGRTDIDMDKRLDMGFDTLQVGLEREDEDWDRAVEQERRWWAQS
jgi:hypothetical protein